MNKFIAVAVFSSILSAFSQVLLKCSANKNHKGLKEYTNLYVIIGYSINLICMILMIIAFKGMPLKYGAVIESLVFVYILFLGKLFFKEKLTVKKVMGIFTIIVGVIIFYI